MSGEFGNEYQGLAQGPIDHNASSVINATCGDNFLLIGEVVRTLEFVSSTQGTQPGDILPRVGIPKTSGASAYGVVVSGDADGIYGDGREPVVNRNELGTLAASFGNVVRVCTQGRCLAEIINTSGASLDVGDPLTGDRRMGVFGAFKITESGDFVLARLLQPIPSGTVPSPVRRIAAVDIQKEGILPVIPVGGTMEYQDFVIMTYEDLVNMEYE